MNLPETRSTIVHFTGTGNSLAVARLLAARLPQATVVSTGEMLKRARLTVEADICGFVFPVYCQNAPEMMRRLVRSIELPASAYVFAVATHNGDVGISHYALDRALRRKGQRLKAGFAVLMPGNSITPRDSMNPEPERLRRLRAAEAAVAAIADVIAQRRPAPFAGSGSLRKRLKYMRNMFRARHVYKIPESFWVTDACDRCGICVGVCPESNIRMGPSLPAWGRRCQMCLACIHWCPRRAIQNGEGTQERGRYHHPDVSVDDMLPKK